MSLPFSCSLATYMCSNLISPLTGNDALEHTFPVGRAKLGMWLHVQYKTNKQKPTMHMVMDNTCCIGFEHLNNNCHCVYINNHLMCRTHLLLPWPALPYHYFQALPAHLTFMVNIGGNYRLPTLFFLEVGRTTLQISTTTT